MLYVHGSNSKYLNENFESQREKACFHTVAETRACLGGLGPPKIFNFFFYNIDIFYKYLKII